MNGRPQAEDQALDDQALADNRQLTSGLVLCLRMFYLYTSIECSISVATWSFDAALANFTISNLMVPSRSRCRRWLHRLFARSGA